MAMIAVYFGLVSVGMMALFITCVFGFADDLQGDDTPLKWAGLAAVVLTGAAVAGLGLAFVYAVATL